MSKFYFVIIRKDSFTDGSFKLTTEVTPVYKQPLKATHFSLLDKDLRELETDEVEALRTANYIMSHSTTIINVLVYKDDKLISI